MTQVKENARTLVEQKYGPVHEDWRESRRHLPRLDGRALGELADREVEERLARLEQIRIELARSDPNAFVEFAFADPRGEPLEQAFFQEDWQNAISEHARLVIIGPRGHGKTTQIVARVIWELGRDPDLRIKIVCSSDAKAMDLLRQIREHLERNGQLRKVFPHLKPAQRGKWTEHKLIVARSSISRDASIEALGITSSATGGRADLLIADDVVDQRNALLMPTLRESIKRAWRSDITQLMLPDSRVVYICTLWHRDDLSHWLMENAAYNVVRHDVGEQFEAIWPEVWSHERLKARHQEIGPLEFARAYRNLPQDESQAPVRPDWIQYEALKNLAGSDPYRLWSYDLAIGEDADHDYFAGVLFAVYEREKRVVVLNAYRDRLSAPAQIERIKEDAKHAKAEVLIETVAFQESIAQFLIDQEPWLTVHMTKPRVNKRMRVDRATPHMQRGQVLFIEQLEPANHPNPGQGDLIGELLDFPFGRHDDMVDAFTQGVLWIAEWFLVEDSENDGSGEAELTILGPDKEPKLYGYDPAEAEGKGLIYYTQGGRPRWRPPCDRPGWLPEHDPAPEREREIVLPPGVKKLK